MVGWREVLNQLSQDERRTKLWLFLEIFDFWSKFLSFKGVKPRKVWWNPKKNLKISRYDGGAYELNFLMIKFVQNFECCSKFSIFGRITWILKVLVHEKCEKFQKKLKSWIFVVWWREVLNKLSPDEGCTKIWVLLEIFDFWSKFLSFKGVSPRKVWRSQKKIKKI